jgi:hypothetical protein
MAESGGSATVYGVLYQILRSLKWIKELRLSGRKNSGELVSSQLILEPIDGGDLQLSEPNTRIVEQCKARRSSRPWSLLEIVRNVFPDLLRAVDLSRPNMRSRYRFVTEGKIADWSAAGKLFQSMSEKGLPAVPLSALSDDADTKQKFFSPRSPAATPRQFFRELLTEVATSSGSPQLADDIDFAKRLWHLVCNFEIEAEVQADEMLARLDDLVAKLVDNPDDRVRARNDLIASVLQLSTIGGTTLSPTEFLRHAKLDTVSLDDWKFTFQQINSNAVGDWYQLFRYEPELDVRDSQLPNAISDTTIVTGDSDRSGPGGSGCGKSYYLGAMAHSASLQGQLVVATRALGSADKTLGRVAAIVWNRGFGRSSSLSLEALAIVLKRECIGLPAVWLTVLVDDLRTADETRELLEFPWQACGIRLIAATPLTLAMMVQQSHAGKSQVCNLHDFTVAELREYLRRRHISWGSLPSDLRSLLRWPLLAQLYCDLSEDGCWRPENEYSLFKKTWDRIVEDPRQLSHEDDQTKLREIVFATIEGDVTYPWEMKSCTSCGLDSEGITRLANLGWTSREEGRVRIRHNRLLCWAVAEAMADQFRCKGMAAIGLVSEMVSRESHESNPFENAELDYLSMDLLWLVTDSSAGRPADAHQIIDKMLDEGDWSRRDNFFEYLLPTLGARAAPVLANYLRAKKPTQFASYINWVTKALKKIGKDHPLDVARVAADMLNDPYLGTAYCAVRILSDYPSPEALSRLWSWLDRLCQWQANAPESDRGIPSFRESDILDALVSCADLDPHWLSHQASVSGSDTTALNRIAYVLARLDGEEPAIAWETIRDHLFAELKGGSAAFAECVARFRDNKFLELMEQWINAGDSVVQSAARNTLAVLAPEKLLEHLRTAPSPEYLLFNESWLTQLFMECPEKAGLLFESLISSSPDKAIKYARCIESWIDLFPPSAVGALTAAVDSLILRCNDGSDSEHESQLREGLRLLAKIASPSLIEVVGGFRNSSIEQRLVKLGTNWVEELSSPLQPLLRVLRHMGGDGLTEVVNAMLRSKLRGRRLDGIEWAIYAPDAQTRSLLRDIALTTDDGLPAEEIPRLRILQDDATERLAELGEDKSLIEALLQGEHDILSLCDLRRSQAAMEDSAIDAALKALESSEAGLVKRALLALGVSGRRDLAPLLLTREQGDPLESDTSFATICGLAGLHADDEVSIRTFGRHLSVAKHRFIAINGLLLSGQPSARLILLEHLESCFSVEPMSPDEQVAMRLAHDPELRDRAMRLLEKRARPRDEFRDLFRSTDHLVLLGEVADDEIRDALFEEADPMETNFHIEGRRASAIRGLAKQAPIDAAEAAQRALQTGKYGRADFADVLIELKGPDAIPILLSQMAVERNHLVRRAIGLSLRNYRDRQLVLDAVADMLKADSAAKRKASAEIIGWLGPDGLHKELATAFRSERLARVRWTMARSLHRHYQQATMTNLLVAIVLAEGVKLWNYVSTLLELDDAKLLGLEDDPLWIWPAIEGFLPILHHHVDKRFAERIKETKQQLKRSED